MFDPILFSSMYDMVFGTLGVPARIVLDDTDATTVDLTVIDDTAGAAVDATQHGVAVQTIRPAVCVRGAELQSSGLVPLSLLEGATITLRPDTAPTAWRIESHQIKPSPAGELEGEVVLVLIKTS